MKSLEYISITLSGLGLVLILAVWLAVAYILTRGICLGPGDDAFYENCIIGSIVFWLATAVVCLIIGSVVGAKK